MTAIKERRLALGLTQPQVASMLKAVDPRMDVAMVSRIENGVCLPTAKVLASLTTILQADVSELFPADEVLAMRELEADTEPQEASWSERLKKAIPYGRENAIRRDDLAYALGVSDRSLRKSIENARAAGMLINNDGDGKGYYQSDDTEDLVRQYRQDTSRALSILYRRKTIRRLLVERGVDVKAL